MNDMMEKERFSPGSQLAILLVSFGICLLVFSFAEIAIISAYLHHPFTGSKIDQDALQQNASLNRLLQVLGTLIIFGLPALAFAFITNKSRGLAVLGFNKVVSFKQVLLALLIIVAAMWVSESLGLVNQLIPLPAGNAAYFKQLEDDYTKQALALLDFKDIGGYLLSVFIIGLLPAILEELIFRGCLQKVLYGLSKHAFLSIFITSLLFSAIHGSYYEFIPRFFLGMILGYMFFYSKNIWLNIAFHFINNTTTITLIYIGVVRGKSVQDAVNSSGITDGLPDWLIFASGAILLVVIFLLTRLFRRESEHVLAVNAAKNAITDNQEEDHLTDIL